MLPIIVIWLSITLFTISGKGGAKKADSGMGNVQDARREMTKTKEQLEEEKRISLSIRIKPLDVDSMDSDQLQSKAKELWDTIVRLETEKYDLEERQKRQDYDVSWVRDSFNPKIPNMALFGLFWPILALFSQFWPV